MPFFNISDDFRLFYTSHGARSNPTILLIHGWCCDSHDWSWQIPFLAKTHHVVAFDLRGHGCSSAPRGLFPYTLKDLASDGIALLHYLKVTTDVTIIGHSFGAAIASVLCVLEPKMVSGLVLIDPLYWNDEESCGRVLQWFANSPSPIQNAQQMLSALVGDRTQDWMRMWYQRRVEGMNEHVVKQCLETGFKDGMMYKQQTREEWVRGRRGVVKLGVYGKEEEAEKEKELGMRAGDGKLSDNPKLTIH